MSHHEHLEAMRLRIVLLQTLVAEELIMAGLDTTKFDAALAELTTLAASLEASISGDVAAAVAAQKAADATAQATAVAAAEAAQLATDQATFDEKTAALQAQVTALQASAAPPPAAFSAPTTLAGPATGVATVDVGLTGGTPPYTASGLPAGATFDGTNIQLDGTQAAGVTTVTFGDSASATGETTLTLS